MPQPLIDFESSAAREQQRREQQQARKLMLDKVRQQHEATERERVAALQRGEHSWMLPSVEAALDSQDRADSKKKKKKSKTDKKKKKKKRRSSSSSTGSSSQEEWVEKNTSGIAPFSARVTTPSAPAPRPGAGRTSGVSEAATNLPAAPPKYADQPASPGPEREGWMEMTSLFGTYTRTELREREGNSRVLARQREKNKQPDKPGSHARELNPYYKEGGSGLPQDRPEQPHQASAASFGPSADWLRKALKRAQEQADEDKIPLQDIAAKRWGSLENFYKMLRDAEEKDKLVQQRPLRREMIRPGELEYRGAPRDRRRREGDASFGTRRDYQDRESGLDDRGQGNPREERLKGNYRDKEVPRQSRGNGSHIHHRGESGDKKERSERSDRHQRQRIEERSVPRDDSPGKRNRRKYRRSESSCSNSDSSSDNSSQSRSRSRARTKERHTRRSKHRSPEIGKRSLSGSTERQSCSPERSSHTGESRSEKRVSRDRSFGGTSDGASPNRATHRLLRPPSDDPKDHRKPRSTHASSSVEECAVWDHARLLSSKRVPTSGGWRKKGPESIRKETPPPRSPKRRRHSNSSDDNLEAERSRSKSPTHAATSLLGTVKNKTSVDHPVEDAKSDSSGTPATTDTRPVKPAKLFTEHELNQLGAKIVKAELLGNEALANKLKKKLEKARKESEEAIKADLQLGRADDGSKREEVVLLTTTNARGLTRPVAPLDPDSTGPSSGHKSRNKKAKVSSVGDDGLRDKYFPDDHEMSLKQMFESEKLGSTADSDALFVRAAARSQRAALDDEYTLDDSFVDRSAAREDRKGQDSRDRMKAIMDHQRREQALASCPHCLDTSRQQKHLIVSLGNTCYLSLPSHQSLVDGHCLVVPRDHLATSTLLDEDTWQEMKTYRQSLVLYFNSLDQDVLFLECCMKLQNMPHTVLNCVPVPRDMGDLAPIYYKKAIQESESEWNQNKKLVDLSGRDVRRAVPKGFPYFVVDFGSSPGYAHVIEDEVLFPQYFGQSVVGGMLDIEPQLWRKPRPEKFDEQRRKVLAFAKQYESFDPAPRS